MGQLNLRIPDEIENELRELAVKKFGARKGFLQKAIEEAVRDWINKNKRGAKNVL